MDQRREMPRRLGPVLLVVVVIAALVGVFAGDGFGEGDTSGVMEEKGGQETEKQRKGGEERSSGWLGLGAEELVLIVAGMTFVWAVVIGVATWRLGRQQKRWAKDFGERQLRAMVWCERFRVVNDATEYLHRVTMGESGTSGRMQELMGGVLARSILFDQKGEAARWAGEFGKRGTRLLEIDVELEGRREKKIGEEERTELKEEREKLVEWFGSRAGTLSLLVEGCVGKVNL